MDISRRRLFGALLGASSSLAVVPSLLARGVADPQPAIAPPAPPPPKHLVPGALDLFARYFGSSAHEICGLRFLPARHLSIGVKAPTNLQDPDASEKFHLDVIAAMANLGTMAREFAAVQPWDRVHFIRLERPASLPPSDTDLMENSHNHSMRVVRAYEFMTDELLFRFDVALLQLSQHAPHSPPSRQVVRIGFA